MIVPASTGALCCPGRVFAKSSKTSKFQGPFKLTRRPSHVASASFTGVPLSATTVTHQQLPAEVNLPDVNALDLQSAKEGLAVLQEYGGKAADVAGAAWGTAISPFQVFDGAWFLNLMFFAILGLMAYSLLILAPRQ